MPASAFDLKHSLLLLDSDEDDLDLDYVNAAEAYSVPDEQLDLSAFGFNEEINAIIQSMVADLDSRVDQRVAWKKERMALTPDIDTQTFEGDIMQSNSYLTQRIPANWDDPELEEMGEIYISAGTMAWPGETEIDYNLKLPPWEVLSLPFGPSDDDVDGSLAAPISTGVIDWNTYDFGEEKESLPTDGIDIDSFFKGLGGAEVEEEKATDSVEASDLAVKIDNIENLTKGNSRSMVLKNWKTPLEWYTGPRFASHVPYEVWGAENSFSRDDEWSDEDVYTAMAMKHVLAVTDVFLKDHQSQTEANDDVKYWERQLSNTFAEGYYAEKEAIPIHLTPDIQRGVNYSNEIIEMKGKMTLHPYQDPPSVIFQNDTFVNSKTLRTMNQIGTIREVYDWTPTIPAEDWHIDSAVVEKIQPLLRFTNHAAILRSTKVKVYSC